LNPRPWLNPLYPSPPQLNLPLTLHPLKNPLGRKPDRSPQACLAARRRISQIPRI
jgi:hypothetical protein